MGWFTLRTVTVIKSHLENVPFTQRKKRASVPALPLFPCRNTEPISNRQERRSVHLWGLGIIWKGHQVWWPIISSDNSFVVCVFIYLFSKWDFADWTEAKKTERNIKWTWNSVHYQYHYSVRASMHVLEEAMDVKRKKQNCHGMKQHTRSQAALLSSAPSQRSELDYKKHISQVNEEVGAHLTWRVNHTKLQQRGWKSATLIFSIVQDSFRKKSWIFTSDKSREICLEIIINVS